MYVAETVLWNGLSQVFAQFCTPNKVAYQTHVKYFSVRNVVMFCKYCNCLFVITETVFQVFFSHSNTFFVVAKVVQKSNRPKKNEVVK